MGGNPLSYIDPLGLRVNPHPNGIRRYSNSVQNRNATILAAGIATVWTYGALGPVFANMLDLAILSTGEFPLGKLGSCLTTNIGLKQFGRSIDDLAAAASKPINKEGLTKAARALSKHASGQRTTGTFPKLSGGITKQNNSAQQIVNNILGNPKSTFTNLKRGGLDVRSPDGRGLRFNSNGKLSGFLDPRI